MTLGDSDAGVLSSDTTRDAERVQVLAWHLFVAGTPLEAQQLERRRRVLVSSSPDRFLYVHSPEDILLQKLRWDRMGGGVSERQWRDVVSILVVQGTRLDRGYLSAAAAREELSDLLERAQRDSAGGHDY